MYTFASRAAACVRAACASERRPHAAKTFPASRPVERERAYFVSSTPVDGTTRRSRSSCLAGIDECQIDAIQRSPRFNKLRTCGVRYTWERGNVAGCRSCLRSLNLFVCAVEESFTLAYRYEMTPNCVEYFFLFYSGKANEKHFNDAMVKFLRKM